MSERPAACLAGLWLGWHSTALQSVSRSLFASAPQSLKWESPP